MAPHGTHHCVKIRILLPCRFQSRVGAQRVSRELLDEDICSLNQAGEVDLALFQRQ
jgi:hypothetical protein